MSCPKKDCPHQDGQIWPVCIGPSGCMRDPLPSLPRAVIVSYNPVQKKRIWKPKVPPKPSDAPRRNISINGEIYRKFRARAQARGESMSGALEREIKLFFGE